MFSKAEKILLVLCCFASMTVICFLMYTISLMKYELELEEERYEIYCKVYQDYHARKIKQEVANKETFYSDTIKVLVTSAEREGIDNEKAELENEIVMMAKILYQEARGISNKDHVAAVAWCVLNRVDHHDSTIAAMITAPNQFAWAESAPVQKHYLSIADDVVTRWLLEKLGKDDIGRILPKEYRYFFGDNGINYFTQKWRDTSFWDWSLNSPY